MQISLWLVGKTNSSEFTIWENDFLKRINSFINFKIEIIENVKNIKDSELIKLEESKKIISKLKKDDYLILLDEKGKSYTSKNFATYLEKLISQGGNKRLIFLVGGAFGFHKDIYDKSNSMLSMSSMTFSHQLIRILFLEQLYRGFAINNNHPYHNE